MSLAKKPSYYELEDKKIIDDFDEEVEEMWKFLEDNPETKWKSNNGKVLKFWDLDYKRKQQFIQDLLDKRYMNKPDELSNYND